MNLLIVAAAVCFVLMLLFHLLVSWRIRCLFTEIREKAPHVWEQIGSPPTLSVALRDPEKRWISLVRKQKFLDPEDIWVAKRIVTVRRRITVASYVAVTSAFATILFLALWL